jgi:hypothetical protein
MNLTGEMALKVNETSLRYGISPLHGWLRCFDFILRLAYRLDLKSWQVREESQKKVYFDTKRRIQDEFISKLSLYVDMPKDSGSGTTSDGNTARKAFRNFSVFAEITRVDEEFIKRLYHILCVINSYEKINVVEFRKYCEETHTVFTSKYDWFFLSPTVHKILQHGADIIASFLYPIGKFSEEALESCNKLNKMARLNHARKTSRTDTLRDQFNYLLVSSDPMISSILIKTKPNTKKVLDLPDECKKLIIIDGEEINNNNEDDDSEDQEVFRIFSDEPIAEPNHESNQTEKIDTIETSLENMSIAHTNDQMQAEFDEIDRNTVD